MKSHGSRAHIKEDQDDITEETFLKAEFEQSRHEEIFKAQKRFDDHLAKEKKKEKEAAKK